MRRTLGAAVALAVVGAVTAAAQQPARTKGGTRENPPPTEAPREAPPGEVGSSPQPPPANPSYYYSREGSLAATLVHVKENALAGRAEIEVKVSGIRLVSAAEAHYQAIRGEGHLLYRMDQQPAVEATDTHLTFSELTPGEHKLAVELVANDGTPLGPHQILTVVIPGNFG